MSSLSHKRRKLSKDQEYQCSENSEALRQDSESKNQEEPEGESKSDVQSSTISQDNNDNPRASGLVRRRKKKVFEDFYYGDDIFSKPKNGAKKNKLEKKSKTSKNKKETKSVKTKKKNEFKQSQPKIKIKDEVLNKQNLNSSLMNLQSSMKPSVELQNLMNTTPSMGDLNRHSQFKELAEKQIAMKSSIIPVRPVAQRANVANITQLLSAYMLGKGTGANSLFPQTNSSQNLDDKGLDSTLQRLLLNGENPLISKNSTNTLSNLQVAINNSRTMKNDNEELSNPPNGIADLLRNDGSMNSSSENEDNSKNRTPIKQKQRISHQSELFANSHEKSQRESSCRDRHYKHSSKHRPYRRVAQGESAQEATNRALRVKKTVHDGGLTTLVVENEDKTKESLTIQLQSGNRKAIDSFGDLPDIENLSRCFSTTSSLDTIIDKIETELRRKSISAMFEKVESKLSASYQQVLSEQSSKQNNSSTLEHISEECSSRQDPATNAQRVGKAGPRSPHSTRITSASMLFSTELR
jgi:hypothetical protein